MILRHLTEYLETIAPLSYQEEYDNSGLIVGNIHQEISSALISLDCTEAVVQEAIDKGCKLIISHHPIVFKGLKKFTGKTYVERVVMKAIKHDIALYAIHTNLDNIHTGVNFKIAEKLGLQNCKILSPKPGILKKLVTYCPIEFAEKVRNSLFGVGAGHIGNYSECSYNSSGFGTFKAGENTNAFVGEKGKQHHEEETRIETIFPAYLEGKIITVLHQSHPYEEIAYDIYPILNTNQQVGTGIIGEIEQEADELDFLKFIKRNLKTEVIRHTELMQKPAKRVAICGGSGGFLLPSAIQAKADIFITADYKYHEFFDADGKIVIADVGHYESEQFTQELLLEIIQKKFPNFALHLTQQNTNPINYLI